MPTERFDTLDELYRQKLELERQTDKLFDYDASLWLDRIIAMIEKMENH